jgi:hypothetical protein
LNRSPHKLALTTGDEKWLAAKRRERSKGDGGNVHHEESKSTEKKRVRESGGGKCAGERVRSEGRCQERL